MRFEIPKSLTSEHEQLHAELQEATKAGGRTGEAARLVAEALHEHFVKERDYALPPLGLLPLLAAGKVTEEMRGMLGLTERLKAELPRMLEEHDAIVAALEHLDGAARQEGRQEFLRFVEKLKVHARAEEELRYPAALLVGEFLKLKLGNANA